MIYTTPLPIRLPEGDTAYQCRCNGCGTHSPIMFSESGAEAVAVRQRWRICSWWDAGRNQLAKAHYCPRCQQQPPF